MFMTTSNPKKKLQYIILLVIQMKMIGNKNTITYLYTCKRSINTYIQNVRQQLFEHSYLITLVRRFLPFSLLNHLFSLYKNQRFSKFLSGSRHIIKECCSTKNSLFKEASAATQERSAQRPLRRVGYTPVLVVPPPPPP